MDGLIGLLILCIVVGLVYWAVMAIVGLLPAPIGNIVRVVALILMVLVVISFLLGETGLGGSWYWHRHHW